MADDARGIYAVADGVGSSEDSARASRAAVEQVSRLYDLFAAPAPAGLPDLQSLIGQVYAAYRQAFILSTPIPATTLTVVAVTGTAIHYASVGDSPLFVIEGERVQLATRKHTLVDQDRTYTSFSEMKSVTGSNVLVNTLGREAPEVIDYEPILPENGCRLLLCTDGLLDFLEQEEVGALSAGSPTAGIFVERIREAATRRTPYDNYSAVVVDLSPGSDQT